MNYEEYKAKAEELKVALDKAKAEGKSTMPIVLAGEIDTEAYYLYQLVMLAVVAPSEDEDTRNTILKDTERLAIQEGVKAVIDMTKDMFLKSTKPNTGWHT